MILVALQCAVTTIVVTFGDPTWANVPPLETERAHKFIRQLDDDDRTVRDRASGGLAAMRRLALPAIRETLGGKPSVEMKRRLEAELPRIVWDDFSARVPIFLLDIAGRHAHTFAGWDEFRAITGGAPKARMLFRRILTTPELHDRLKSVLTAPSPPAADLRAKWWLNQLYSILGQQRARKYSLDDGVTVVACGLLVEMLLPEDTHGSVLPNVLRVAMTGEGGKMAIKPDGPYGNALVAVINHWMATRTNETGIREAEETCNMLDLGKERELSFTAKRVGLKDSTSTSKMSGMSRLAGTGDKKYLPVIRALLTDTSTVAALGKAPEREVRECALAMCLVATGQSPADYGFVAASDLPGLKAVASNYWFDDDKGGTAKQKREAAFAKWDTWVTKNLPDEKKK